MKAPTRDATANLNWRGACLPGVMIAVTGSMLYLILREIKALSLLLEKSVQEQQRGQQRVQQTCDRLVDMVDLLEQRLQQDQKMEDAASAKPRASRAGDPRSKEAATSSTTNNGQKPRRAPAKKRNATNSTSANNENAPAVQAQEAVTKEQGGGE